MFTKQLAITIATISLFLSTKSLAVDTCYSTPPVLFFGNGFSNTYEEASDSLSALVKKLRENQTGHPNISKWAAFPRAKLAYNHNENMMTQLIDAVVQKSATDLIHLFDWLSDSSLAPDWFKDAMNEETQKITETVVNNDPDATAHAEAYLAELRSGNSVVVTAHSQGNFYANLSLQFASQTMNAAGTTALNLLSIATPASYVFNHGPYLTLTTDNVIKWVLGSLPANVSNISVGTTGHSFVSQYVTGDVTGPKMIQHLETLLGNARPLPGMGPNPSVPSNFENPWYVHQNIGHVWLFARQMREEMVDRKITDAECLAVMAVAKTEDVWGGTCLDRSLQTVSSWLDSCYANEWQNADMFAFQDCVLWGLADVWEEHASTYTMEEIFAFHPECRVTNSNFFSKVTPTIISNAKKILADPSSLQP